MANLDRNKTLESALYSIRNDWRLTGYAASLCAVNTLAVISRRQLWNEICALGDVVVRDRRGEIYNLHAGKEVWNLLHTEDDPTAPGVNGEFLISFRELGDTRIAMVKLNPTPGVKQPNTVTI